MGYPRGGPTFGNAADNYDPADPYGDPVALLEHRERQAREGWVQVEAAKLVRQQLRECYWRAGVNHHEECSEIAKKYLATVKGAGFRGKASNP
eukprot:jgi/Chlat1/4870/Chrsp31S04879